MNPLTTTLSITLLLLLSFFTDHAFAKYNWGSPWTESRLNWKVYTEPTGKEIGYYQLDCSKARETVLRSRLPEDKAKNQMDFYAACELGCRCNMWGDYLLNPMAGSPCNDDSFLARCQDPRVSGGEGCACAWIQEQDEAAMNGIRYEWRKVEREYPGQQGDIPPNP